MIIGDDLVVESGNGRILALRKASQDFPEQYAKYKKMLESMADRFGINKSELAKINNPVLVRERTSKVDRVKFAAEANVGAVMAMSPYEQALQDSGRLSPNVIGNLEVGEEQTIDQALRMRSNDNIIKHFVINIPATERASIADEKGAINQQGIERLKLAIFAKTYTGDAGKRLVRIFGESADPMVKSIENAMFASLPDMAKAEGLIAAKQREADLSIAPDMAEVIDTYASLKATGLTIPDYLAQQAMFEDRLNPFQKKLLEHLDDISRKPKHVREMLRDIAGKIVDAPAKGQIGMMGLEPLTKEAMVYAVINKQRTEIGKSTFRVTTTPAKGKELEKPDTPGTESAGRLGQGVGFRTGEDTGLAARTSAQVGLAGLGKETSQVRMLEEFGGAPDAAGKKETLIDIEAEKRKEAAKPLPGQVVLKETKPAKEPWEMTREGYAEAQKQKSRELIEAWNKAGSKGFPPTARPSIYEIAPLAEKAGYTLPRDAEKVLKIPYHQLQVEAALAQGKSVPPEVLKGYPDLVTPEITPVAKPEAKPRKEVAMKKKPTTMARLRSINTNRSESAIAADKRQRHHKVIEPTDTEAVKQWIKDPGSADVRGVDTPVRKVRKPKPTKPKSERVKRVAKGIAAQTARGLAQDRRQSNKDTISKSSPRFEAWQKNPGSMDVQGIDTPRITKGTPGLSRRSKGITLGMCETKSS